MCYLYGCVVCHILLYTDVSFVYRFIYGCTFCMLMFNFVNCVLLLLCIVIVMCCYCCVLLFLCIFIVMCSYC